MFTSNLTGLAPNSIYFIRAYATNATGTAYGNELSFTNACATYSPVSVSISVSQNPICAQTLATFSASPTNGGTSPTYQWKVNGMNTGDTGAVRTVRMPRQLSSTCNQSRCCFPSP